MPASCDCEMRPPEPLPEREASPHDEQAADDFASSAARLPSRARSEYARAIRRNQFSCTPSSKLLLDTRRARTDSRPTKVPYAVLQFQ